MLVPRNCRTDEADGNFLARSDIRSTTDDLERFLADMDAADRKPLCVRVSGAFENTANQEASILLPRTFDALHLKPTHGELLPQSLRGHAELDVLPEPTLRCTHRLELG